MGILRLIGIGLCWGILLLLIGAAVGSLLVYVQLNNEVQKHVLAQLQQRYPNLDVRVGSAQIIENRGLTVKDVEFSIGPSRKLLYIGELFIESPVTLQSLYQKNPRISRIVMKNPILRASRYADGTFHELQFLAGESDSLFLFPEGGKPILMDVENGMLLYDDVRQPAPPLRLSGINLAITPEIQEQTQRISIKGTAEGDFFRRLDIDALLLPETKQWQLTANCRQFDWTDDLWQYVPPHPYFQQHRQERPLFQGRFDFNILAVSDAAADWGCRFAVGGTLVHGRIDFPHINRTLTELSTRFEITNERIVIDKLIGNGDSARFAASYVQHGLTLFGDKRHQAELTTNVHDLRFNDELIDALSPFLNEEVKRLLAQYDYEGTADVYAQHVCQDGEWHPRKLSMKISDLGLSYRAFPYRLDRLAGDLNVDETASLYLRFTTKHDAPLKAVIEGRYSNVFIDPTGRVEITGEDVPIDAKLLRALPLATQQVITSLHPTGKFKARLTFELPPGDAQVNKQFDIALDRISVLYEHFPYPLRDVTGFLHYDGDTWQFRDLLGINGTAVVKGAGQLQPIDGVYHDARAFLFHLSAEELPVDDQIAQALLHPEQRQLLQSLNVNGRVNLAAQIHYRTDERRLNLTFQAEPRPGLSIYPERFPYKIEDVAGIVQYQNGRVFAETLTGMHRNTKLRSGLDCRFDAEGQSMLRLAPLTIDQLQADRELMDALPKYLQNTLEAMQITKPFNLSGGIQYEQTAQGEQALHWDLNCILHQNSAKLGLPVENIFGIVRLTGHSIAEQLQLKGELQLDSLMVSGFPITEVRGPFFFDSRRLRLGVPANPLQPDIVSQPLTGKFCGGTIRADGLVISDNGITYNINADLQGADMAKIALVVEPMAQNTSGTLNISDVNFRGIGTKWETASGTGKIQLRDANIGGAPVMVRLFRELRIKPTDPNAGMFSSVDVDFQLSGWEMFYDSVVFEGGLISMHGNGMVRLDNRQVDLMLKTRLGNRRMQIPGISDIIGGASDQLVQLRITGPLTDPVVTRLALPEIQRALLQIQPDTASPQPPVSRNRFAPSRLFQWNPL